MSRQLEIPGVAPGKDTAGTWTTLYGRVRSAGTKVAVALPPRRDAIVISVGPRRVYLEHAEVPRVAEALGAAMEDLGL